MKQLLLSLLFLISYGAHSQNGKLLNQTRYEITEAELAQLEKGNPEVRKSISGITLSRITYLSYGYKVTGYLMQPKKAGKYPCVIYNRGGNKELGKVTNEQLVSRGLAELCRSGYVVVASQYRGNDGGEGQEEFGGKDVNDVLHLIPLLAGVPEADTSRIGMYGWSRGGMMTYLALTRTSRIKAAVVGSGATDLIRILETRSEFNDIYAELIPDYSPTDQDALKQRSAVYFFEKMNRKTPTLILHGTADWRVPANQILELVGKLHGIRFPFRFIFYEGGDHSLVEHRAHFVREMQDWFETYLRDRKPWPSLEPHGK